MPTKIEWCDETINPIQDSIKGKSGRGYHCTKCSIGCLNCYAERINKIRGNGLPFDNRKANFQLVKSELEKLVKWKKPRSIFIQSMGDLFHEDVPFEFIELVIVSAQQNDRHTYLFLTKRPQRIVDIYRFAEEKYGWKEESRATDNFYWGLTVCNQQEADEKIPVFLKVPGKKFLSIEPCLGAIDLKIPACGWKDGRETGEWYAPGISLCIMGGETGPCARLLHPDWVQSVRDQCQAAGVPFFFKSWGDYFNKGVKKQDLSLDNRTLDGRTHDDLLWVKK